MFDRRLLFGDRLHELDGGARELEVLARAQPGGAHHLDAHVGARTLADAVDRLAAELSVTSQLPYCQLTAGTLQELLLAAFACPRIIEQGNTEDDAHQRHVA